MKITWIPSTHPISDIRDWSNNNRLELRPDYQRNEVWSEVAKIQLIDSILNNIPIPKVFFSAEIREGETFRVVIDGQQRLLAILSFLRDEYALKKPYEGDYVSMTFSQLPKEIQNEILNYRIDTNEIRGADDDLIRLIYSRVNKYTVALNKQELRRADYPGDFLKISEDLVNDPFFERARLFSAASLRRMGDVEFVSELLALLIDGTQDKKDKLDDYYLHFMEWNSEDSKSVINRFKAVLNDMSLFLLPENNNEPSLIMDRDLDISKSRFRQKADFYSLFAAIDELRCSGGTLEGKPLRPLIEDMIFLDDNIEPESPYEKLSEYAIKCLSQGNTKNSRIFRIDFIKNFLVGTYNPTKLSEMNVRFLEELLFDYHNNVCDEHRPLKAYKCPICNEEIYEYSYGCVTIAWEKSEIVYGLTNANIIHCKCLKDNGELDTYFAFIPGIDHDSN